MAVETFDIEKVKFDEKGLVPCIVQDVETKRVLTLAYMNFVSRWRRGLPASGPAHVRSSG